MGWRSGNYCSNKMFKKDYLIYKSDSSLKISTDDDVLNDNDAIFIYYNGINHYDGILREKKKVNILNQKVNILKLKSPMLEDAIQACIIKINIINTETTF